MTRDQTAVAIGAVSGVAAMGLLVWLISNAIDPPAIADTAGDRIAYALRWALVAVLPLVAMIVAVGNARALRRGDRPNARQGKPGDTGRRPGARQHAAAIRSVPGRPPGAVGVAAAQRLSIIAALAIVFVMMRLAFWVGYRIKPVYRAFGFASTFYMNLGMLLAALWLWARPGG